LWILIGRTLVIGRSAAVEETRRLAPPMATGVDVRGRELAVSAGLAFARDPRQAA
jgi:hypothetical protein